MEYKLVTEEQVYYYLYNCRDVQDYPDVHHFIRDIVDECDDAFNENERLIARIERLERQLELAGLTPVL